MGRLRSAGDDLNNGPGSDGHDRRGLDEMVFASRAWVSWTGKVGMGAPTDWMLLDALVL